MIEITPRQVAAIMPPNSTEHWTLYVDRKPVGTMSTDAGMSHERLTLALADCGYSLTWAR